MDKEEKMARKSRRPPFSNPVAAALKAGHLQRRIVAPKKGKGSRNRPKHRLRPDFYVAGAAA